MKNIDWKLLFARLVCRISQCIEDIGELIWILWIVGFTLGIMFTVFNQMDAHVVNFISGGFQAIWHSLAFALTLTALVYGAWEVVHAFKWLTNWSHNVKYDKEAEARRCEPR